MVKKSIDVATLNSFILNEVIKKPTDRDSDANHYRHRKQKEHVFALVNNIITISDGQATLITNSDTYTKFKVQLLPKEGPYHGGCFIFSFKLPAKYPSVAPEIKCVTDIYHPNIDDDGEVCLSLLDDWCQEHNDLIDCIQGLLYLMYHPNLDDPLNPNFAPYEFTMNEFQENVQKWMKGESTE